MQFIVWEIKREKHMKNIYFKLEDNFEKIINKALQNKKINKIKLIPTGWTNIVYEVEAEDGEYFFRFPRDEFWSRTIVKDCEFAKYIHNKTDFNTVQLQLFYDNGRPFSMHKKIPGTPLAEKMNSLNDEEVKKVSKDIAKFMYQMHNVEYSENEIFNNANNIGLNLNEFLDELLNVHVSSEDIKFWHNIPVTKEKNCLVHGDLNSSNILLDDNNNISAVIDFGFGGFGNKYDDVARIIGRCPENFKKDIVESYEEYSNSKLDSKVLDNNIQTWSNIDNAYINYMETIGIYKR